MNKRYVRHHLISISLLISALAILVPFRSATAVNFNDWDYRMKITFEGYSKRSALSNFPVLVILGTNIAGFSYDQFASTNGGDLRFTDSTGTNEINYEMEEWSTNSTWVWVQVPMLDGSNDYIWAYWGNGDETNFPAYTSNGDTWDPDYLGVWHLDQIGGVEDVTDSSGYSRDLTDSGTTNSVAQVSYGQGLNGGDNLSVTVVRPSGYTISMWLKTSTAVGNVSTWGWPTYLNIRPGDGTLLYTEYTDGPSYVPTYVYGSQAIDDGAFRYVTLARAANGYTKIYIDGEIDGTGAVGGPSGSYSGLSFGSSLTNATMDEVRVSDMIRSADWLWTEWFCMASNGALCTYGTILSVPKISNDGGASNVTGVSATLNGEVTSTNAGLVDARIYWGTTDGTANPTSWLYTNVIGSCNLGLFSSNVTGLTTNTFYYYRAAGTNLSGDVWANETETFITTDLKVYVPDGWGAEEGPDTGYFSIVRPSLVTNGPLTVNLTIGGNATEGEDYDTIGSSVVIPAGATNVVVIVTPLTDSNANEGNETVTMALAPGGYIIGSPSNGTVNIEDEQIFDGWVYKTKITFTGYDRSEVLSNFPALIVFSTNITNFAYGQFASDEGYDLRILDEDDTSILNYEIEEWNTNGDSIAWVQVPAFTNNCFVWAYWGNPDAASAPEPYTTNGATWDTQFEAVWHLDQTNGVSDLRDSTSHHRDGSYENGGTTNVVGKFSYGERSEGGNISAFSPPDNMPLPKTYEAWVKIDVPLAAGGQLLEHPYANPAGWFKWWVNPSTTNLEYDTSCSGAPGGGTSSKPIPGGRLVHIAMTRTTGSGWGGLRDIYFYIDGEPAGSGSGTEGSSLGTSVRLLGQGGGYFSGIVDEFRISNIMLSTNWIWACARLTNSDFSAYTPVEQEVPTTLIKIGGSMNSGTASNDISSVESFESYGPGYLITNQPAWNDVEEPDYYAIVTNEPDHGLASPYLAGATHTNVLDVIGSVSMLTDKRTDLDYVYIDMLVEAVGCRTTPTDFDGLPLGNSALPQTAFCVNTNSELVFYHAYYDGAVYDYPRIWTTNKLVTVATGEWFRAFLAMAYTFSDYGDGYFRIQINGNTFTNSMGYSSPGAGDLLDSPDGGSWFICANVDGVKPNLWLNGVTFEDRVRIDDFVVSATAPPSGDPPIVDNNGGVSNVTTVSATLNGRVTWVGTNDPTFIIYCGPDNATPIGTGYKSPTQQGDPLSEFTNPTNAYASDDVYAEGDHASNDENDYHGFEFDIPAGATLLGIEVVAEWRCEEEDPGNPSELTVDLSYDGGSSYTAVQYSDTTLSAEDSDSYFGNATNLWGRSWTTNELGTNNFRVRLDASDGNPDVLVDWLRVQVYYTTNTWLYTNNFGPKPVGHYYTNLTGLTPDTLYFYQSFGANSGGVDWADTPAWFITSEFWIDASDPIAGEPSDTGTFTIYRPNVYTDMPVTVYYAVSGTAEAGVDYTALSTSVVINAGQTGAVITVSPIDDLEIDPDETVVVSILPGNYAIGAPSSNTVTITNNDFAIAPVVNNTLGPTAITPGGAQLNGEVTAGDPTPTVYFHWGDEDRGTNNTWDQTVNMGTHPGAFSHVLGSLTIGKAYYYRCSASNAYGETWSPWTMCWLVRNIVTGRWQLVSTPVQWGASASNQLDGVLGEQLATGLYNGGTRFTADNLWVQNDSANWQQYYWHTSSEWRDAGDNPTSKEVEPGRGYWIKRLTSGPATNIIFAGRVPTNSLTITFAADTWQTFGWPYPPRHESEGWGFTNGTGSYSWRYGDNMLGEYNGQEFLIYLGTNGRWYVRSTKNLADVKLEPGRAYWYRHRGGGMQWKAEP